MCQTICFSYGFVKIGENQISNANGRRGANMCQCICEVYYAFVNTGTIQCANNCRGANIHQTCLQYVIFLTRFWTSRRFPVILSNYMFCVNKCFTMFSETLGAPRTHGQTIKGFWVQSPDKPVRIADMLHLEIIRALVASDPEETASDTNSFPSNRGALKHNWALMQHVKFISSCSLLGLWITPHMNKRAYPSFHGASTTNGSIQGGVLQNQPPLQSSLCHPAAFQQLPPPPFSEFVKGCPQVLWRLTQRQTIYSATNFFTQRQTVLPSDKLFTQRQTFYSATNFFTQR